MPLGRWPSPCHLRHLRVPFFWGLQRRPSLSSAHELQLPNPLHIDPFACVCAQRGVHLSPFGRSGGFAHLVARRQCGGRRHRRCCRPDHHRAGEQWFGLGCFLYFVGWSATARPQCLRLCAPGLDTGLLSVQIRRIGHHAAQARHGFGHHPWCGVGLGRLERAFWQVAV